MGRASCLSQQLTLGAVLAEPRREGCGSMLKAGEARFRAYVLTGTCAKKTGRTPGWVPDLCSLRSWLGCKGVSLCFAREAIWRRLLPADHSYTALRVLLSPES